MKNARALSLVFAPLSVLLLHCGGPELEQSPEEDLGPYAEKVPFEEFMAASLNTVGDVGNSSICSTASISALSDQIVAEMNCVHPNLMANISGDNVSLAQAALPYLQTQVSQALKNATHGHSAIPINSALRTLAQQWLLYHWYETGRCGIQLAAVPGRSNHEGGLALDTPDYNNWRSILDGHGFRWFGSADVVHFDYVAGGPPAQGVLAFQRLWNRNNPHDQIGEDGQYGPQTEARIMKSPRRGFASAPHCS